MELIREEWAELPTALQDALGKYSVEEFFEKVQEALEEALAYEGVDGSFGQVSLNFVEPDEIQTLNRDFRGVDRVTDVLSFPQFASSEDIPKGEPYLLGDVVINIERAKEQAAEYGHSTERELVYLFTHSIFHLLGYDHMEDEEKKEMRVAEEHVMARISVTRED